jgi:uncharacterized protein YbjQ (UPF0145 family)
MQEIAGAWGGRAASASAIPTNEAVQIGATSKKGRVFLPPPRLRDAGGRLSKAPRRCDQKKIKAMQVSSANRLEGGRRHHMIGRITASSRWRAANAPAAEIDRRAAIEALIRGAEDYDADAIVGLQIEVDRVRRADFDATPLQRVTATGIAVKFDEAA